MINIAIDGPSGAGKSTIARRIASKLGYIYVDTGAMYRSVGVYAMRKGVPTDDRAGVVALLPEIHIELKYIDGEQRVILNGDDVSKDIRLPEASMAASNVSAFPEVRVFLLEAQRSVARSCNCLMDGRDIGTVILPDATLKIFLSASAEARTKRRFLELQEKGTPVDFDTLLAEINQRDYNDSHRSASPLCKADDAVEIDSTNMGIDDVVERVIALLEERI